MLAINDNVQCNSIDNNTMITNANVKRYNNNDDNHDDNGNDNENDNNTKNNNSNNNHLKISPQNL